MTNPSLSLLVVRSSRLEASLAFYRALGLSFVEEQHGSGPIHYSTRLGDTVLEIYPGESAAPMNRRRAARRCWDSA